MLQWLWQRGWQLSSGVLPEAESGNLPHLGLISCNVEALSFTNPSATHGDNRLLISVSQRWPYLCSPCAHSLLQYSLHWQPAAGNPHHLPPIPLCLDWLPSLSLPAVCFNVLDSQVGLLSLSQNHSLGSARVSSNTYWLTLWSPCLCFLHLLYSPCILETLCSPPWKNLSFVLSPHPQCFRRNFLEPCTFPFEHRFL